MAPFISLRQSLRALGTRIVLTIPTCHQCPCSYCGVSDKQCTCTMAMISKYQKRISGPILDRIDIRLGVLRVPVQKLSSLDGGEPSASICQCVEAAR